MTRFHTVVAEVDVGGVAVMQPLERARNINVEEEVVRVIRLADSLQVTDEILADVDDKRLGGPDLVIGGRVEIKDPSAGGYNLVLEKRSINSGKMVDKVGRNRHSRSLSRLDRP